MAKNTIIQTGVDKLVEIVKSKKRISIPEAAKMLGVTNVVVEEWADFLQEEGIINIEYKFATPYLIDRTLSKKEVEDKINDFKGQKEGFIRKAEVALNMVDQKGKFFQELSESFKNIKNELSTEVNAVSNEVKLLEKYNQEKTNIDNELHQQELLFKKKIMEMESQIDRERSRYQNVLTDLEKEQSLINNEMIQTMSLKQMVTTLEKSMGQLQTTAGAIQQKLAGDEQVIDNSEQHIKRLKDVVDSAKNDVESKQKAINDLVISSKEQEQRIVELQQNIINKAREKKNLLDSKAKEGSLTTKKFKKFFEHHKKIEEYLTKINENKNNLQHELEEMIQKAKAFQLIAKKQDVNAYISELQKKFKQVEKDKENFEKEVTKLRSFVKG